VTVRHATESDRETVRALWQEFVADSGPLPPWADGSWETASAEIDQSLAANGLFVAERDGEAVGFASAWVEGHVAHIGDLYVRGAERGRGTGRALVDAVVENTRARGATHLLLNGNLDALAFYERLGFREESRNLVLSLERREVGTGRSFGAIHVQSDDLAAIERAVRQFVPRLPGGSQGSLISPPRNGWIAVYDDVCDRDSTMLRRLARELSDRMGAVVLSLGVEQDEVVRFVLHDRGGVVDEYLSVPEHYGALPSGDVIALAANPRVVNRLTGADPAQVRAVARTAASPVDLPPARELLAQIARVIGLEGTEHGWGDAPDVPGAIRIER
jgi:ribosomal protein S18 acetylase RimI-like enzyme